MAPRGIAVSPPRRSIFEPQCTHLTVTRIYDPTLLCAACHRPGPDRWVYHCTQDREDLIEHAICRGEMASFDVLGHHMVGQLRVRKGSPAAREDKLSFFGEITPKQMSSYRPDQVATMLRQRQNVQAAIQLQRLRNDSAEIINRSTFPCVFQGAPGTFEYKKPWVCSVQDECQYRVCSRCRPGSADWAFLSLNAVANGEVPPTVTVGFGFYIMGERLVVNAYILRNLGRHTAPTSSPRNAIGRGSFRSRESIRQLFENSIAVALATEKGFNGNGDADQSQRQPPKSDAAAGSLKHSPRCANLGVYADPNSGVGLGPVSRLPWTPPPSPNPNDGETSATDGGQTSAGTSFGRAGGVEEIPRSDAPSPPPHKSLLGGQKFTPSPLKVGHGVAVLEESVELGVPDVITHA